jgi:hypothetical protein
MEVPPALAVLLPPLLPFLLSALPQYNISNLLRFLGGLPMQSRCTMCSHVLNMTTSLLLPSTTSRQIGQKSTFFIRHWPSCKRQQQQQQLSMQITPLSIQQQGIMLLRNINMTARTAVATWEESTLQLPQKLHESPAALKY